MEVTNASVHDVMKATVVLVEVTNCNCGVSGHYECNCGVEVENAIVVFVGATVVLVEVTNATQVQFQWNRF